MTFLFNKHKAPFFFSRKRYSKTFINTLPAQGEVYAAGCWLWLVQMWCWDKCPIHVCANLIQEMNMNYWCRIKTISDSVLMIMLPMRTTLEDNICNHFEWILGSPPQVLCPISTVRKQCCAHRRHYWLGSVQPQFLIYVGNVLRAK